MRSSSGLGARYRGSEKDGSGHHATKLGKKWLASGSEEDEQSRRLGAFRGEASGGIFIRAAAAHISSASVTSVR